jgi:hypothetical protein
MRWPVVVAAAVLVGGGVLIGRISVSVAENPAVHLIPFPAECETEWTTNLKLTIETGTGAKVSVMRLTDFVPQYPNLAGVVRVEGASSADLRRDMAAAMTRCYANADTAIPLNNPQFGRMLQLTIADFRQNKLPLYLTLEGEQIVVHYNQPLPVPTRQR